MIKILQGHWIDVLKTLPDESVQMCVTSPPYFGLRSYLPKDHPLKHLELGTEKTPKEYISKLVDGFREVNRVLKKDGVIWVNIGDSFCSTDKWGGGKGGNTGKHTTDSAGGVPSWAVREKKTPIDGLKPKDLIGIPWMMAFALRDDGWYLRSDIIWAKKNCMPESVSGSHFSRHRVTIQEYENLSGMQYTGERDGDAWAGNMPHLSEIEIPQSKAPLSAKREGKGNSAGKRGTRGCAGKEKAGEPLQAGAIEQIEIRSNAKRHNDAQEGHQEISRQTRIENKANDSASSDKEFAEPDIATKSGQQPIQENGEWKGTFTEATRQTEGCDSFDSQPADSTRLAGDTCSPQSSVPLLLEESEVDNGSRDTTSEGWPTCEVERSASLPAMQQQERRPPMAAVLVGCPGCPKCVKYHGYIFHLSAGRPTRSHEYIFLLSKSASYFYDHEAIKEPGIWDVDGTGTASRKARASADLKSHPNGERSGIRPAGFKDAEKFFNDRWDAMTVKEQCVGMRNKRDVWSTATACFPEAHFATFPRELISPCILAGSRYGDTVLDCFGGSGTTGMVSLELGRKAILIELNPDYIPMAERRTNVTIGFELVAPDSPANPRPHPEGGSLPNTARPAEKQSQAPSTSSQGLNADAVDKP